VNELRNCLSTNHRIGFSEVSQLGLRLCYLTLFIFTITVGRAQTYVDLHDFGGTVTNANATSGPDGIKPQSSIVYDNFGNSYGATTIGGANGCGIIWVKPRFGSYINLHDFGGIVTNADGTMGPDGQNPCGNITIDAAGNLYGTTQYGGPGSNGVIWKLTKSGTYTDLHDFGNLVQTVGGLIVPDGALSYGPVAFDSSGNMYGTASSGGKYNTGMVWELSPAGTYLSLHDFGGSVINANGVLGPDGQHPYTGVTFDSSGNLYGTTVYSGRNSYGMLWKITTLGAYVDVHDFGGTATYSDSTTGPDGQYPYGGVAFDGAGHIYGTSEQGGALSGGVVWSLVGSSYTVLHSFGGIAADVSGNSHPDGYTCTSSPALDEYGNLYGTAQFGGAHNDCGMVWELTATGHYYDLHDFGGNVANANHTQGPDGKYPGASVCVLNANLLMGTTMYAGPNVASTDPGGMMWELIPPQRPGFKALRVDPNPVIGGNSVTGTIDLTGPANTGGLIVTMSSNNPGVTVPASLLIPDGSSYINFTINTATVHAGYTATITGTIGAISQTANLTVNPSMLNFQVSPSTVVGGVEATGTVNLNGTAGPGGVEISVDSNNASATVPATFTIPEGASSGNFTIGTSTVTTTTKAIFTVTYGVTTHNSLTIIPGGLQSFTVAPTSLLGGNSSTGTVTLTAPAPVGGTVVSLSSTPNASVPATVTVPAGSSTATFPIGTVGVDIIVTETLTATLATTSLTANLTLNPATLAGFIISPATVVGGTNSSGKVNVNGKAGSSGIVVNVSSNSISATVPATVTIPSGSSSVTFSIGTTPVTTTTSAIFAVTYGVTTHNSLTITPGGLASVTLSQNSVTGGNSVGGTVTLSGPAPSGGTTVALSSDSACATVPASVTVASGATSASFTVNTSGVDSTVSATISATLGATTKTAGLNVNPPAMTSFLISPSSIMGGSSASGRVTLNGQAGPSGVTVSVTSNNSSANVPASFVIPNGATSGSFTINTSPVPATATAILAVTYGVTVHNSLTILPGGLVSVGATPNSLVGGKSATGTVTLSGPAPTGGTTVSLASDSGCVYVPVSVTVPAGATSATFSVSTSGVDSVVVGTFTGTLGTGTRTASITVNPAAMLNFVVSPSTVQGGNSAIGTVNLNGQAGPSGISISVTSNSGKASVPATFAIPPGATSGTFTINTSPVGVTVMAIFAVTFGVTTHNSLTITP